MTERPDAFTSLTEVERLRWLVGHFRDLSMRVLATSAITARRAKAMGDLHRLVQETRGMEFGEVVPEPDGGGECQTPE